MDSEEEDSEEEVRMGAKVPSSTTLTRELEGLTRSFANHWERADLPLG